MSDASETVADKIKSKRLGQELAQQEEHKRTQARKDQQKKEHDEYETALKEQAKAEAEAQAKYEKQIEEYNKAEQELAKQLQEQKAEEEAKKQKEEAHQANLKEITDKYNSQIAELEKQKQEAVQNVSKTETKYKVVGSGGGFPQYDGTDITISYEQRKDKAVYNADVNRVEKIYNKKIDKLIAEKVFDIQSANAYYSGIPAPFIQQALRLHRKYKYSYKKAFKGKTITQSAEAELASFEAQSEHARQSSITTAKSKAIQAQTKLDLFIQQLQQKKAEADKLVKPQNISTEKPLTKAEGKKQPKVLDSVEFRKKFGVYPDYKKPPSIIGTTEQQSRQAVKTFEQTQKQQKELYWKITSADEGSEALAIRSRYQEANAYLGTPQTLLYKGGVVERQGVLIEKKLLDKFPEGKIESYEPLASPERKPTKTIIETPMTEQDTKVLPTYDLLDDQGNIIDKPTEAQLYNLAIYLTQQKAVTPSQTDQILSKYWEQNAEAVSKSTETGETKPLIDTSKPGLASSVLGHEEELEVIGHNIINPDSPKEPKQQTLESLAIGDIIESGKYYADPSSYENYGKEPPSSKAIETASQMSKTPEGLAWLAGTVGTSIAIGIATVTLPPLAIVKYGKYVVTPRNKKIAEEIAEKFYGSKKDKEFEAKVLREQLKKDYPLMPEKVIKRTVEIIQKEKPVDKRTSKAVRESAKDLIKAEEQEVKQSIKEKFPELPKKEIEKRASQYIKQQAPTQETPYTVEAINEKTFLITGGTESQAIKTPAMIVRTGKKGKTSLFEVIEETETVTPSGVIVRGTQKQAREIITAQPTKAQSKEAQIIQKEFSEFKKGKSLIESEKAKKIQQKTIEEVGTTEQGKKIVKGTEAEPIPKQDVKYYTVTEDISKVIQSEEGRKYLAPVGTIKDVMTKELKKYPRPIIESVEKETPKTGTLITETEAKDPLKSFMRDVKSLQEPESAIKTSKTKPFKPDDDIITNVKGSAGGSARAKGISDDIKTSMTKLEQETATKTKSDSIKTTAREIAKSETGSDFYAIEGKAIGISTQAGKVSIVDKSSFKEISKLVTLQQEATFQNQKPDIQTKLQDLLKEKKIIIDKQQTGGKRDELYNPRYSLIVTGTQTYKGTVIPKYILKLKEDTPTTTKPPFTTGDTPGKPPPKFPVVVLLPEEKITKKKNRQKRKQKISFTAWNVDAEEPGFYLPGKELRVTKTSKAWRELDRVQKTGSPRKKSRKKASRYDDDYYDDPFPTKKTKGKRRKFKFF